MRAASSMTNEIPLVPAIDSVMAQTSALVNDADMAGERVRRGFSEHIIILPAADSVRVASRAAEALGDLRALHA
jgi:hypothetical protein